MAENGTVFGQQLRFLRESMRHDEPVERVPRPGKGDRRSYDDFSIVLSDAQSYGFLQFRIDCLAFYSNFLRLVQVLQFKENDGGDKQFVILQLSLSRITKKFFAPLIQPHKDMCIKEEHCANGGTNPYERYPQRRHAER